MTERARTYEQAVALAIEAADRLFDDDGSDRADIYEPVDGRTACAAVRRLGELFAGLPRAIVEALNGARSSGELLSGDRLQGARGDPTERRRRERVEGPFGTAGERSPDGPRRRPRAATARIGASHTVAQHQGR